MLFFKLLGKRGAAITEYAVLLAFVAVIATSFTKSDGLEDSMRGFISRVEKTVGVDNNYPGDVGGSGGEGGTEEGGSGGGDNGNTGGGNTGSGTENGGSHTVAPHSAKTVRPSDCSLPKDSHRQYGTTRAA